MIIPGVKILEPLVRKIGNVLGLSAALEEIGGVGEQK